MLLSKMDHDAQKLHMAENSRGKTFWSLFCRHENVRLNCVWYLVSSCGKNVNLEKSHFNPRDCECPNILYKHTKNVLQSYIMRLQVGKKQLGVLDFTIYLQIMAGICSGQVINYNKVIFTNTSDHSHTFLSVLGYCRNRHMTHHITVYTNMLRLN